MKIEADKKSLVITLETTEEQENFIDMLGAGMAFYKQESFLVDFPRVWRTHEEFSKKLLKLSFGIGKINKMGMLKDFIWNAHISLPRIVIFQMVLFYPIIFLWEYLQLLKTVKNIILEVPIQIPKRLRKPTKKRRGESEPKPDSLICGRH